MEQVNLEALADGPAGGRGIHSGGSSRGENVLLQHDIGVWVRGLAENKWNRCANRAEIE